MRLFLVFFLWVLPIFNSYNILPTADREIEKYFFDTAIIYEAYIDGIELAGPETQKVIYWVNSKDERYQAKWTIMADGKCHLHFIDFRKRIRGSAFYDSQRIFEQETVFLPYHLRPIPISRSHIADKHLDAKKTQLDLSTTQYRYVINKKRIRKAKLLTAFEHIVTTDLYQRYDSPSFDFLKTPVHGKNPYSAWIVSTKKIGLDGSLFSNQTLDSIIPIERSIQLE